MKCEVAQQHIALLVYQELADDARHQLNNHLAGCGKCSEELEGVQALYRAMAIHPMEEPSPNLVTRARMRLEEALDSMPNRGWASKFTELLLTAVGRLQAAPAVASVVLIVGLAAGGFAGYRLGSKTSADRQIANADARVASEDPIPESDLAQVTSVSSIVRKPDSEDVEVHYNRIVPQIKHGRLDDNDVRRLLVIASESRLNDGIRGNSVKLIANECHEGHMCGDGPLRGALLSALRHDASPSVRLSALAGLQPYVDQDLKVRDAVLKAITSDRDAEVRLQAINVLTPVEGDSSVRGVLNLAASRDTNPKIRTVSQQLLASLPETQ
ncbi:MAG TPA: HEAT repeat domain-containing protein [Acidisarcina sp.]